MEMVALKAHPRAGVAYVWADETDDGGRRYVAVLGAPRIKSALDAVRAPIVAERGGYK